MHPLEARRACCVNITVTESLLAKPAPISKNQRTGLTLAVSAFTLSTIITAVEKVPQLPAASLRRHRHSSRSSAKSLAGAARFCLILLACLVQLSTPVQHLRAPAFAAQAAQAMVHETGANGSADTTRGSIAAQSDVPCPFHSAHAKPPEGGNGAPCHHGNCPFCPCPCSAPMHAAMGILPQATARAALAPPFFTLPPPPARLGSPARFAVIAGQPRAPPILI